MKMSYTNPEMEVVLFEAEDVIATSGLINGGTGSGDNYNADELFPLN